jgi:hypothetical protein
MVLTLGTTFDTVRWISDFAADFDCAPLPLGVI